MIKTILRGLRTGALAGFAVVVIFTSAGWSAEKLSAATQKLFDAVWADDLAGVKTSITAGADLAAVNEFGVRPVDMAVDKGHYDIAHYLLSVEKLRRDTQVEQPRLTPQQRVQNRAVEPAPLSESTGPGWLTTTQRPAQPAPALVPSAPVQQAPIAAAPTPAQVPEPAPPVVRRVKPQPQEKLWTPGGGSAPEQQPSLKVVSVAEPRPVPAVPELVPEAAPQTQAPAGATGATPGSTIATAGGGEIGGPGARSRAGFGTRGRGQAGESGGDGVRVHRRGQPVH